MTAPLDPDVEAAGIAYRDAIVAGVGVFAAGERLRAAIRTACVAAERRGIERAAKVLAAKLSTTELPVPRNLLAEMEDAIRALPVPESTEAEQHGDDFPDDPNDCKQHAKQYAPKAKDGDKVIDLMEALKASLAKAKESPRDG